jgi:hypothetical protein
MCVKNFIKKYLMCSSSVDEKDLDISVMELPDVKKTPVKPKSAVKKSKSMLSTKDMIEVVINSSLKKDFMYISKNYTFNKIQELLDNKKVIICDLHDRDGKIGLKIIGITNSFTDDDCIVTMKGGIEHKLLDKFLYNIIYNTKKDEYYLEEQDEYFEKILTKDED